VALDEPFDLSISEVHEIFLHMRSACDSHEIRKFRIRSTNWTIDGTDRDSGTMIMIAIREGIGGIHHPVRRDDAIRAADEFSKWLDRLSLDVGGPFA
jgi:hypothetical protein